MAGSKVWLVLQGEIQGSMDRRVEKLCVIARCTTRDHAEFIRDGLRAREAGKALDALHNGPDYVFEVAEMDLTTGEVR